MSKLTREQFIELFVACDDEQKQSLMNRLCFDLNLEGKQNLFLRMDNIELRKLLIKSRITPEGIVSLLTNYPAIQDQILSYCSDHKLKVIYGKLQAGALRNKVLSSASNEYIFAFYSGKFPGEKQAIIRSLSTQKLIDLYFANDGTISREDIINAATAEQYKALLAVNIVDNSLPSYKELIVNALIIRGELEAFCNFLGDALSDIFLNDAGVKLALAVAFESNNHYLFNMMKFGEDETGQVRHGFSSSFRQKLFSLVPVKSAICLLDLLIEESVENTDSILKDMCRVYGKKWFALVLEGKNIDSKSYFLHQVMTDTEVLAAFLDIEKAYSRNPKNGHKLQNEMIEILGVDQIHHLLTLANDEVFNIISSRLKSHEIFAEVIKSIGEEKDKQVLNRLIQVVEKDLLFDRTSFANQFVMKKLRAAKLEADGDSFVGDVEGADYYQRKIAVARDIKLSLEKDLSIQLKRHHEVTPEDFSQIILQKIAGRLNSHDISRRFYTIGNSAADAHTPEQKKIALTIASDMIDHAQAKAKRNILVKCIDLIVRLVDSLLRPHKTWVSAEERKVITGIMQEKHALRDRTPNPRFSVNEVASTEQRFLQPCETAVVSRAEIEIERGRIKMAAPSTRSV